MRLSTVLRELFAGGTFAVGTICMGLSVVESHEQIHEAGLRQQYYEDSNQSEFDTAKIASVITFGAGCIVGSIVIISLGPDEKPAHT